MSQTHITTHKRPKLLLPLNLSISIGLVFAAIIPLLIMVGFIVFQTRPALINQANNAMTSDAQTRVQFIDTYFNERLLDIETLTQVTSTQQFLQLPPPPITPLQTYQESFIHGAVYALAAGIHRSTDYTCWALFDIQGNFRAAYAPSGVSTTCSPKHGNSYQTADQMQMIKKGIPFISPVYYSPTTHKTSVDIYGSIHRDTQTSPVVGFLRATLILNAIDNIVQKNTNSIGSGSYAMILDDSGIRIAGPTSLNLFTSVAPLNATLQQQITSQQRFGTTLPVQTFADPNLAHVTQGSIANSTFQDVPTSQNDNYQVVQQTLTMVPWHYFVFSPVSTVTDTATKQMQGIFILACVASLIVASAGIFFSRSISRPILQAIAQLRENSKALSTLASNQQSAASEQVWVVDSSQVGLQSVQYYTEATRVASRQLKEAALGIREVWQHRQYLNPEQIERALEHVLKVTNYIENATEYQDNSNQKLSTALKVATQVTEQLHMGATSASEAAAKLEEVVQDLRSVAGR